MGGGRPASDVPVSVAAVVVLIEVRRVATVPGAKGAPGVLARDLARDELLEISWPRYRPDVSRADRLSAGGADQFGL